MEDRKGVEQDIPLVSVSVGIATTSKRAFAHYGEAVAVATEMKQFAKRDGGSSYAVHRRAPRPSPRAGDAPRTTSGAVLYWRKACFRGGGRIPTGGDSPRPFASHARVDPVRSRDRP